MLNPPGSCHPALHPDSFPYDKFMGTWHVVWSTLPLWKGKKDVNITYKPLPGSTPSQSFDDLVEYRKQTAAPGTAPSTVKGIDKRDKISPDNGVTFNWRGRGLLMIASSRWEVLGYDTASPDPQWAVTYFSKTLFTPAGLDVYVRHPLNDEADRTRLEEIVGAIRAMSGEPGHLCQQGFIVGEA